MMPVFRRTAATMLFGLVTSAALDTVADSTAATTCMFPGWKTVLSTNWDVNTSGIQNWSQMLTRWADGEDCDSDACRSTGWPAMVGRVKAAGELVAQVKAANLLINDPVQNSYKEDVANWNVEDYWETPYEFLEKSGDAEDFAIAKYFLLKAAGVPVDDMEIIMVRLKSHGDIGHAILAVRLNSTRTFILDNRVPTVLEAKLLKHEFKPVLGINESNWCAYIAQQ